MKKVYWLGLRRENVDTSLEEWLEYGCEEEYDWDYVMCTLGKCGTTIVSEERKQLLELQKELLQRIYPNNVYEIFEVDV